MINLLNVLRPSAAYTTTYVSDGITTMLSGIRVEAVQVFLDVTAAGSGSVIVKVQGRVPGTPDTWFDYLTSAAITTNGTYRFVVGPNATAATGLVAKDYLCATLRVSVTHANSNPITYSLAII